MFTRKTVLLKKTGPDGIDRYSFLKQLISEFTTSTSIENKRQTLANLANFAYDAVNFEFLKQLQVVDLFLAQLSENNEELMHFALAGLCNLSPDPEFKAYIIGLNGIKLISEKLSHKNEEILLNAVTTLYYLTLPEYKGSITTDIKNQIKSYKFHQNLRLRNIGSVFIQEMENA